jgi:hypothetical protein
VLRRIFGTQNDKIIGDWNQLPADALGLSSLNQVISGKGSGKL